MLRADSSDEIYNRFLERYQRKKEPEMGTMGHSDFSNPPDMYKAPALPETSALVRNTEDYDAMKLGTCEGEKPCRL
jgi:hypothetical protein